MVEVAYILGSLTFKQRKRMTDVENVEVVTPEATEVVAENEAAEEVVVDTADVEEVVGVDPAEATTAAVETGGN